MDEQGCSSHAIGVFSGAMRGRILYVDIDMQLPFFMSDTSFLGRGVQEVTAVL
jgi:hypothetical protein